MSETIALRLPGLGRPLRVRAAPSWRGAIGLPGNPDPDGPHGSWLRRCRRIHTIGLARAVDVVFLRADGVVTKVVKELKPWRSSGCPDASTVLQLRAGLAERLRIEPGTALDLLA